MNTILLVGYFGYGNVGDEWLKEKGTALLKGLYDECLIEEASKKRPFSLIRSIATSDIIVFPGGSLLQNHTSMKSLLYYGSIALLGRLLGKKVWLLAQGVGPLHGWFAQWFALQVTRMATVMTVRDERSKAWLRERGVIAKQYADLVYTKATYQDEYQPQAPLGLSFRSHDILPVIYGQLRKLEKQLDQPPVFISCQKGKDKSYSEKHRSVELLEVYQEDPPQLSALLTMRYHAGVWASLRGIPFMAIGSDPKLIELAKACGQPYWEIKESLGRGFLEAVQEFLSRAPHYQQALSPAVERLIQKAGQLEDDLSCYGHH